MGRTRVADTAILALCVGVVLTACGTQVAPIGVGSALQTPEPIPTVTTTARDETGFGLGLATIDDLVSSPVVHVVVEGTVSAVAFERGTVEPQTSIVIAVERARGTSAREVTVEEAGGVVRASELWSPPPRPPKAGSSSGAFSPSTAASDRVIDMQPEWGAARAAVGDRVVMFLYSSRFTTTEPDHYILVGGTLGRFRYDEESGEYLRAGTHKGWSTTLPLAVLDRELTPVP